MKLKNWSTIAKQRLESHGIEQSEARLEVIIIIEELLGLTRAQQLIHTHRVFTQEEVLNLNHVIDRRCHREPLAHILGSTEFWGLNLKVTPDTLIPRADTEVLVEEVLKWIERNTLLIDSETPIWLCDVGTGTGCISIALASEKPQLAYHLIDCSIPALHIAQSNWQTLCEKDVLNSKTLVQFSSSDLLGIYQKSDLVQPSIIVSNPPYIKYSDRQKLMPEVGLFDPAISLFDEGIDGLNLTRRLIRQAMTLLPSQGALFLEVGFDQTQLTQKVLDDVGFINIQIRVDYGGNPRVVIGIKP